MKYAEEYRLFHRVYVLMRLKECEKVTDQFDYLNIARSFILTISIVKRDPSNP
jgi:hypothetical protein